MVWEILYIKNVSEKFLSIDFETAVKNPFPWLRTNSLRAKHKSLLFGKYHLSANKQRILYVLFFQQKPRLLHSSAGCIRISILDVKMFQKNNSFEANINFN